MIETEFLIIVVFRLLNFLVFAVLLLYLAHTYLIPAMKTEWAALKAYIADLTKMHRRLLKEKHVIEKTIGDDREWQAALKDRVIVWRSLVDAQRDALLHARDQRKHALEQQVKQQAQQIALYRMSRVVVPRAVDEAREVLEKQFATHAEQQRFIEHITTFLRKQ